MGLLNLWKKKKENKPIAIGLEMAEGRWILQADGVLHFSGGKKLTGGAFDSHRRKVKRIVIEDFEYLGPEIFAFFCECEEVTIHSKFIHISKEAFASCSNLQRVTFPKDGKYEIEEEAFKGTPYAKAMLGEKQTAEEQTGNWFSGEYGSRFLQQLHETIEIMNNAENPKGDPEFLEDEGIESLTKCTESIFLGFQAKEPVMMFLGAEFARFDLYISNFDDYAMDLRDMYRAYEDPFTQMYLDAANAGSIHAKLWCTYCYENNPDHYPQYAEICKETALLEKRQLPKQLGFKELDFLKGDFYNLVEHAYDVDREEDMIEFDPESPLYRTALPNPDWRCLQERYTELAWYMLLLGLDYVTTKYGNDCAYSPWHSKLTDHITIEKYGWKQWYSRYLSAKTC